MYWLVVFEGVEWNIELFKRLNLVFVFENKPEEAI
jgi:hypothetical protein